MDPISIGLGAIQGLSGLAGILGGNAARRRAEAARQQALTDLSASTDRDYDSLVMNDRQNLLGATGLGGDAINSLGRGLGANLAASGVYNSSATAGALAQATSGTQANLAGLAASNFANEQGLLNQNRRYLASARLGTADQDLGYARQDLSGSRQGLSSFLGTLGQFNLARSGGNLMQSGLGRAAGGYGSQGPLSLGAGMGGGSFNPYAFGTPPIAPGYRQRPMFGTGGYNSGGY